MQLKKVTVYFTAEEYAGIKAIAEDEGVTVSAVLRAKLGLDYKRRGAPEGNAHRRAANTGTRATRRKQPPLINAECPSSLTRR